MGKLSQWREASSWRLEKRRGSWRNARRRGRKTNTQEPSRFPDMNMSPTFSPPPTNTTRLTRQGSPFHEAPPQRQGEGDSGKPWLPRPVLSVLVSARKPQAPSVRGNRDSWSLSLPLSLPPAPPPASSLRNKPCQSPGGLPPTHPLLAGSGGRGSSDLRLPEPLCSRVQGWPCTSSLPAPQRLPDVALISQH